MPHLHTPKLSRQTRRHLSGLALTIFANAAGGALGSWWWHLVSR